MCSAVNPGPSGLASVLHIRSMPTFAERLQVALDHRHWSQNKLEREAKLTKGRVNKILHSKSARIDPADLIYVARALEISHVWLVLGEGDMEVGTPLPSSAIVPSERERRRRFGELSGWAEAEAEAKRQFEGIPEAAFAAARSTSGQPLPELVDVTTVARWATTWLEQLSREERHAAEQAELRATLERCLEPAVQRRAR